MVADLNVTQIAQTIIIGDVVDMIDAHRIDAMNQLPDQAVDLKAMAEHFHDSIAVKIDTSCHRSAVMLVPAYPLPMAIMWDRPEEHPFRPFAPFQFTCRGVVGKQSIEEAL